LGLKGKRGDAEIYAFRCMCRERVLLVRINKARILTVKTGALVTDSSDEAEGFTHLRSIVLLFTTVNNEYYIEKS